MADQTSSDRTSNDRVPSTGKQGSPAKKLSVRLFLLDPDKKITKVTKGTCSKEAKKQLMQNGYGPPRPGKDEMHRILHLDAQNCHECF